MFRMLWNIYKKALKFKAFFSRGRGNRTPVNGFGDRRTTAVLFPYLAANSLTKDIVAQELILRNLFFIFFATARNAPENGSFPVRHIRSFC